MDIRSLRYFIAVAEKLNFSEAAKHLYVSQPSISKQISDLEAEIGVTLLIRNTRSVRLTSAGEYLLKEARILVAKSEEIISCLRKTDYGYGGGVLRIGYLGATEKKLMPTLIKNFQAIYPNVELKLYKYDWKPLNTALERGDIDIGFTLAIGVSDIAGIRWEIMYKNSLAVVLPIDHPLANKTRLTLAELVKEKFVDLGREGTALPYSIITKLFTSKGYSVKIEKVANRIETVLLLIEAGIGIGILAHHVQVLASPNLRFIEIESNEYNSATDVVAAWQKNNDNPYLPLFLKESRVAWEAAVENNKEEITL